MTRIRRSTGVRRLRAAVFVVAVLAYMPTGDARGAGADSCSATYPDCDPQVCSNYNCAPCTSSPGECATIQYLTDPFCDQFSGDCWECSDCAAYWNMACNYNTLMCDDCRETGSDCADGFFCNPDDGWCYAAT